jgi:hypothetical protein
MLPGMGSKNGIYILDSLRKGRHLVARQAGVLLICILLVGVFQANKAFAFINPSASKDATAAITCAVFIQNSPGKIDFIRTGRGRASTSGDALQVWSAHECPIYGTIGQISKLATFKLKPLMIVMTSTVQRSDCLTVRHHLIEYPSFDDSGFRLPDIDEHIEDLPINIGYLSLKTMRGLWVAINSSRAKLTVRWIWKPCHAPIRTRSRVKSASKESVILSFVPKIKKGQYSEASSVPWVASLWASFFKSGVMGCGMAAIGLAASLVGCSDFCSLFLALSAC